MIGEVYIIVAWASWDNSPALMKIVFVVCFGIYAVTTWNMKDRKKAFAIRSFMLLLASVSYVSLTMYLTPSRTPPPQAQTNAYMGGMQTAVKAYMLSHAPAGSTFQFLDWSNVRQAGSDWTVDCRYSVTAGPSKGTTALVRFTVRGGTVVNARVL